MEVMVPVSPLLPDCTLLESEINRKNLRKIKTELKEELNRICSSTIQTPAASLTILFVDTTQKKMKKYTI